MREILFRGKPIDDKDFLWVNSDGFVYGAPAVPYKTLFYAYYKPYKDDGDYSLVPIEVDPSTVGQYTGLTDKNGKKIFEGDILHVKEVGETGGKNCVVYFGKYIDADSVFDDYRCIGFYIKVDNGCCTIGTLLNSDFEFEVIGNIHDNPELLR